MWQGLPPAVVQWLNTPRRRWIPHLVPSLTGLCMQGLTLGTPQTVHPRSGRTDRTNSEYTISPLLPPPHVAQTFVRRVNLTVPKNITISLYQNCIHTIPTLLYPPLIFQMIWVVPLHPHQPRGVSLIHTPHLPHLWPRVQIVSVCMFYWFLYKTSLCQMWFFFYIEC